jgi:hypothetical protein
LGKFVSHVRGIVIKQRLDRRLALLNPAAAAAATAAPSAAAAAAATTAATAAAKSSSRISQNKIVQKAVPLYRCDSDLRPRTISQSTAIHFFAFWYSFLFVPT